MHQGQNNKVRILLETAKRRFTNMKEIPVAGITLSEEVRKLCQQNTCGNFGKNWTCPPAVESIDVIKEKINRFDTALIVYKVSPVKSSFDWKGMMAAGTEFKDSLLSLKKEIAAADPEFNFMLLGAGACHLCDPCAYVDGEPCRNPEDAVISLEACGIDVMRLMKDHGLPYYNGKGTVTFIGGILYNQL